LGHKLLPDIHHNKLQSRVAAFIYGIDSFSRVHAIITVYTHQIGQQAFVTRGVIVLFYCTTGAYLGAYQRSLP
jgi:hypothetical protein